MPNRSERRALLEAVSADRDHVRGLAGAPVTLLEYGDYECPYCGAAYPIVRRLLSELNDHVRFAFRNFPLTQLHPHAEDAAETAEAAASQGRFWQMHDLLFENQNALEMSDLREYAGNLGLDTERFSEELERHVHARRIRRDFMGGVRSGVNGTPTFYINGLRHTGAIDLPSLHEAIERGLYGGAPESRVP